MYSELLSDMVNTCPPGSRGLNDELYPKVATGDQEARDQMILANMALVVSKVEFMLNQQPDLKFLRDDMISAGFLGLTQGVDALKGAANAENPTGYLSVAIQNEISHLVDEETTVSVPWQTQTHERRNGREVHRPEAVPDLPEEVARLAPDHADAVELRDFFDSCCDDESDRTLLRMRQNKCTFSEIGEALGQPLGTVSYRYHKLRQRIIKRYA